MIKKGMVRVIMVLIPLGLMGGCVAICYQEGKTYRYEDYTYYLGATVIQVTPWVEEQVETIFYNKYYTERKQYEVEMCTIKVAYDDGYVKTLETETSSERCSLLKEGDWVDGWRTNSLKIHRETGEEILLNAVRRIELDEAFEKAQWE